MKKSLLFIFILGILSLTAFSQPQTGTDYVTLPLSGELECTPPVHFVYESTLGGVDTVFQQKDPIQNSTTGSSVPVTRYTLSLMKGKVGIGVPSPEQELHVKGNGLFSGRLSISTLETDYYFSKLYTLKLLIGDVWTFFDLSNAKIMGYNTLFMEGGLNLPKRHINGYASAMIMKENGTIQMCTAPYGTGIINGGTSDPLNWNYLTMLNNGNVGIGTTSPTKKLHVEGDTYLNGNLGIGTASPTQKFHVVGNSYFNGNVGIGTDSPQKKLHVQGDTYLSGNLGIGTASTTQKFHVVGNSYFNGNVGIGIDSPQKKLHVQGDTYLSGNVGIGTANTSSYKLTVDGKINCTEVVVTSSVSRGEGEGEWPDYVFAEDYNLRSLDEVASYIEENKRLPEIPSAAEVSEKGVNLLEINTLLLKKVEELTLYIIQQQKEIDELKKR